MQQKSSNLHTHCQKWNNWKIWPLFNSQRRTHIYTKTCPQKIVAYHFHQSTSVIDLWNTKNMWPGTANIPRLLKTQNEGKISMNTNRLNKVWLVVRNTRKKKEKKNRLKISGEETFVCVHALRPPTLRDKVSSSSDLFDQTSTVWFFLF